MTDAERIARAMHDTYERLAPGFQWETQERSRKPWDQVPENNRQLMIATAQDLLRQGVIKPGEALD